jgi:hypothetical protein
VKRGTNKRDASLAEALTQARLAYAVAYKGEPMPPLLPAPKK